MSEPQEQNVVRKLGETERRVLGVLLEKAFTTPEYYPMTLKGLTSGCNQKNNRDPVLELSEDDVDEAVSELEKVGLTERLFPESGRTERIRHWARKRFSFSEAQLAIMTELWLRGRQSLGDLRVRASRMEQISDLDKLRAEVKGLMGLGFVQANGALEMRGVEVDHTFYAPTERRQLPPLAVVEPERVHSIQTPQPERLDSSLCDITQLKREQAELRDEVVRLKATVEELSDRISRITSELGMS